MTKISRQPTLKFTFLLHQRTFIVEHAHRYSFLAVTYRRHVLLVKDWENRLWKKNWCLLSDYAPSFCWLPVHRPIIYQKNTFNANNIRVSVYVVIKLSLHKLEIFFLFCDRFLFKCDDFEKWFIYNWFCIFFIVVYNKLCRLAIQIQTDF